MPSPNFSARYDERRVMGNLRVSRNRYQKAAIELGRVAVRSIEKSVESPGSESHDYSNHWYLTHFLEAQDLSDSKLVRDIRRYNDLRRACVKHVRSHWRLSLCH